MTLDLGNCIEEQHNIRALALHRYLLSQHTAGVYDVIVAYSSVTICFDPIALSQSRVHEMLERAWRETDAPTPPVEASTQTVPIPVCYQGEYAPDIEWVVRQKGLSVQEIINIHCAAIYRVYMIGFLPGFSYMGTVDEQLQLPRKPMPVAVAAGGVGIAGLQTGIYPLASPGGWQIIGRTPVKMFDVSKDPPVFLQPGDRVQFHPISTAEFRSWRLQ